MTYTPEIAAAKVVARLAHRGQRDKAGRDYFQHVCRVANHVVPRHKAAAYLHDVVEDTDVTLDDLRALGFREGVIGAVDALTRRPEEAYFEYLQRLIGTARHTAIAVKLADIEDHLDATGARPRRAEISASLVRRYEKALAMLRRAER